MDKILEEIAAIGVTAALTFALTGCGARKGEDTRKGVDSTQYQTVQLSNGMSASGDVKISSATGAKAIVVPGYGKMIVYDSGRGNVFVTYDGKRLSNLTYTWGDRQFPAWEPYAFRESPEYHAIQSSLMVNGRWCPEKEKKKETKKNSSIPYSNF